MLDAIHLQMRIKTAALAAQKLQVITPPTMFLSADALLRKP